MAIGHWTKEIFHKGVIQKKMEEPQKLMEESNLGNRFTGRSFASFDAKRDRTAFDACSKYANDDFLMQKDRNGLLLAGGYGSGKTHLAAAVSNVLIDKGVPVLFGTSIGHLENLRSEIDNTQQKTYLSKMKVTPVLVIDDLGKEKKSEWTQQVLFDVVNYRYEHKLPLIITTNLASDGNYDDLANYVEGAVYSRLCEMCDTVETKASDYRQR
jgi:DNA replication protein DnaC